MGEGNEKPHRTEKERWGRDYRKRGLLLTRGVLSLLHVVLLLILLEFVLSLLGREGYLLIRVIEVAVQHMIDPSEVELAAPHLNECNLLIAEGLQLIDLCLGILVFLAVLIGSRIGIQIRLADELLEL